MIIATAIPPILLIFISYSKCNKIKFSAPVSSHIKPGSSQTRCICSRLPIYNIFNMKIRNCFIL